MPKTQIKNKPKKKKTQEAILYLEINGSQTKLSLREAKRIHGVLDEAFGNKTPNFVYTYSPTPPTVVPETSPWYNPTMQSQKQVCMTGILRGHKQTFVSG